MLRGYACPALEDAAKGAEIRTTGAENDSTHGMLLHQLLRDILKVPLAHSLEPISDFLLHELIFLPRERWKRPIRLRIRLVRSCG